MIAEMEMELQLRNDIELQQLQASDEGRASRDGSYITMSSLGSPPRSSIPDPIASGAES